MVAHALLGRLPPCLLSSADIPTLMYNIQQDPEHRVNLIGAAVGNGVGGHNDTGGDAARGRALFYYGKGLFSTTLKDTIEKECGSLFYPSAPGWAKQSPACSKVRDGETGRRGDRDRPGTCHLAIRSHAVLPIFLFYLILASLYCLWLFR